MTQYLIRGAALLGGEPTDLLIADGVIAATSGDATAQAGEDVETLGGYLVNHVGRLPVRGEVISGPGNFEIEVLDADPRRIKRVRIHRQTDRRIERDREGRRRYSSPEISSAPAPAALAEIVTDSPTSESQSKPQPTTPKIPPNP